MALVRRLIFPFHVIVCLVTGLLVRQNPDAPGFLRFTGIWGLIFFSCWYLMNQKKPYRAADGVTGLRLLAGLVYALAGSFFSWPPVAAVLLILFAELLDGVDGKLARRQGPTAFGAQWDSETDAYFILILSFYAFMYTLHSPWVLLPGLIRYLFYFPFRGLKPDNFTFPKALSYFSKTVCVITVLAYALLHLLDNTCGRAVMIIISTALIISFLWETAVYIRLKARKRY